MSSHKSPTSAQSNSYRATRALLSQNLPQLEQKWRAYYEAHGAGLLYRHPDWLKSLYVHAQSKVARRDLWSIFVERGNELVGVVPFVHVDWFLEYQVGEITVAKPPLRRLLLPFSQMDLPEDDGAYDAVFSQVLGDRTVDALYFEDLRVDSPLWKYIGNSPLVSANFHRYQPREQLPHSLVDMTGTFEDYLQKFSSKTRNTLTRKVKKLAQEGAVEVTRIDRADQISDFVDEAEKISQRSYQYNLFGAGIRKPEDFKQELRAVAELGWLRCYLMRIGGKACSFLIGYQDAQNFYYMDVAYDQDWGKLSVGTVLQYYVLEDLFKERTPHLYDFCGGHGEHKVFFETHHYDQADVYLFRKRIYPTLALAGHWLSFTGTQKVGALLDKYGLKQKVKQLIRSRSVQ